MSKAKGSKPAKGPAQVSANLEPAPSTTGDDVPLSEDTFSNLRNKISAQLKSVGQKPSNSQKNTKSVVDKQSGLNKGKKRTADGKVVTERRPNGIAKSSDADSRALQNDDDHDFRNAVKELGGTQEDIDLIAGADSESEFEGLDVEPAVKQDIKKKNSTLEAGMANILREIALAQNKGNADYGDSEEEQDSEDQDETQENRVSKDQKGLNSSTKEVQANSTSLPPIKRTRDSRLKCQPQPDWFNISSAVVSSDKGPEFTPSLYTIEKLHSYAKSLLTEENDAFKSTQQSSSSQAFYNTVIASGTLSDKISALTLAVQESPLHNVKALETLINLAGKRNRAQAIDVLRALKDLIAQGALLPSDRRLFTFGTQPALLPYLGQTQSWKRGDDLPRGLQESDLICWAFEDWLKQQYFEILKILETWCNDEIEYAKSRAVSYVYELLKEKPEQESNLLRLLINKIGDPVKKIASQTSYLIMQLLSTHPAMKMIVVSAIEADFIFRPGQSMHGKYYAVVTLNQTALSAREEDVAKKLLDIYFGLFTSLLRPLQKEGLGKEDETPIALESTTRAQRQRKKKGKPVENTQEEELREKLISAVLTGVNRAYPYVGTDQKNFMDHLETLFKITHSANFNTSIQAMLLIQQLTATHSAAADRFYRTLYESLLDPRLINASKQQLYLNLLHRSLKTDMNTKRVKAFIKRLLQVLSLHDPSFVCGVFFLLQDLEKSFPSLTALVDQPEDHEDDEEVFRDVVEDVNELETAAADNSGHMSRYNGTKRAPEHANADNSCAWEVLPFLAHFHPSITISTDHYMQHTKLPGKPDLSLHTMIHFLDRFVYRNPKLASNKLRGSSIMQPMANDDTHAVLISSTSRQTLSAVNTTEFRNKKDEDIAADDVFFHKYFNTLGKDSKPKIRKNRDVDEEGSVGDEGEDAVWKAMMDSAPDLEGVGSEDDDLDMSDFEEEMDAEDVLSEGLGSDMDVDDNDDDGVDIEAGIFDESDDGLDGIALEAADEQVDSESEFGGLDSDVAEEDPTEKLRKEKRKAEKDKRKKMKALPTFASAADYAKMLENDEDEDLG